MPPTDPRAPQPESPTQCPICQHEEHSVTGWCGSGVDCGPGIVGLCGCTVPRTDGRRVKVVPPEPPAPVAPAPSLTGTYRAFSGQNDQQKPGKQDPARNATPSVTAAPALAAGEPLDLVRELNAAAFAEGRIVVAEEANGNGWSDHCATAEKRRMAAFRALSDTVAALSAERAAHEQQVREIVQGTARATRSFTRRLHELLDVAGAEADADPLMRVVTLGAARLQAEQARTETQTLLDDLDARYHAMGNQMCQDALTLAQAERERDGLREALEKIAGKPNHVTATWYESIARAALRAPTEAPTKTG